MASSFPCRPDTGESHHQIRSISTYNCSQTRKMYYLTGASCQADLDGGVPSPLLRSPAGGFSRFGLIRLKFLLRHFDDSVFGFVQLGAFLCGALLPPSNLQKKKKQKQNLLHKFYTLWNSESYECSLLTSMRLMPPTPLPP